MTTNNWTFMHVKTKKKTVEKKYKKLISKFIWNIANLWCDTYLTSSSAMLNYCVWDKLLKRRKKKFVKNCKNRFEISNEANLCQYFVSQIGAYNTLLKISQWYRLYAQCSMFANVRNTEKRCVNERKLNLEQLQWNSPKQRSW